MLVGDDPWQYVTLSLALDLQ
uniref:Uncharacterized protein n=1 Tax=Arundo donax TaxID=35708 RepID=A0A0A9FYR2_ARUDO